MLRARHLEFAYDGGGRAGARAAAPLVLRGVSMDVGPGDFTGILGPNGSGKTTLLRALSGTIRPSGGEVTLDGTPLAQLSRGTLARRMAVVPQETHLAFDYTVLEVVLMGRYVHLGPFEIEGPRDLDIAREALEATGTRAFEDRLFATLSGGEKQRVIIASALAQIRGKTGSVPVLLLDEPTAALDLSYQLEAAALLRDLQARLGIAIIVSTHDLNFAAAVCRTLVLLKDGRVLAAGPTRDVLTADNIAALYGVHAEVQYHPSAGHLVVVPIARHGDEVVGRRP
ncbi:MAG TPA: ABC transporter ATP-binding protein [Vicinamibacterales bacterium]|nr:ABC transporter ATP-binding protein [Vicinamibacterales bacterium]